MTEDEAKTKWCPFARMKVASHADEGVPAVNEPQTTFNRIAINSQSAPFIADQARCIGSACMAWRRQTVMVDRATNEPAIPGVTAIGQLEERYSAHGYCGLAGAPS
jgi:hypothetical protein